MNIYQLFRRKNNVSVKSESSYLLIAAYFLLKIIIKGIESNPRLSYRGAYGIKKAVQGTFHQGNTRFGETAGIQCTSNAYFAIIFSETKNFHSGKQLKLITYQKKETCFSNHWT